MSNEPTTPSPDEPHVPAWERHAEPVETRTSGPAAKSAMRWGMAGLGLLYLASKLKFLLPALKFLKLGKVLTTGGTMLLSMWAYAAVFGWSFGVGFVILIFVHEMGHVFVAWRQGLPISAPVFIPFMGAMILQKRESEGAWAQAVMGIGGPIGGTLAALACHGVFLWTGHPLFLGLAYVGYFLNLFNLMPAVPLDGGWIVGALSPWLWLVGLVALVGCYVGGVFSNPFVLLIVLLSLPRLWQGLRHGAVPGGIPATTPQKWIMGLGYIGLAGFLAWAMAHTFEHPDALRPGGGTQATESVEVPLGGQDPI